MAQSALDRFRDRTGDSGDRIRDDPLPRTISTKVALHHPLNPGRGIIDRGEISGFFSRSRLRWRDPELSLQWTS